MRRAKPKKTVKTEKVTKTAKVKKSKPSARPSGASVAADAIVNIHEAKTHLSRLLARVRAGEKIIIACDGEPVANLTRAEDLPKRRAFGQDVGRVWIADDFDAPLSEEEFPFPN